ncbi:MAG: DUF4294 domain-containing protein [Bacteroidota bacterium]
MKQYLFFLMLGFLCSYSHAQDTSKAHNFKIYSIEGVMIGEVDMDAVEINGSMPTKAELRRGKKRLARYNRLRWHVHKVYPYAVKVAELLEEVNATLASMPEGAKKRKYIKEKEKNLFGEYEDDIRRMTRSQGKILVKLVHRETGTSMYGLIKDMKNGTTAVFWQSIGMIFGINLKAEYDVEEEELIESFVNDLERGGYNLVYKQMNYRLD